MSPTLDPQQLLNKIGVVILDAVPDGWRCIDLRCFMTVRIHKLGWEVIMEDGSKLTLAPPDALNPLFVDLRRATYQMGGPGTGAWFSARYTIKPPSSYYISYNFDFDPQWNPAIPTEELKRDLDAFPRFDQYIPDWLRARLDLPQARKEEQPGQPIWQDQMLQKITVLLALTLPAEWLQMQIEYRALGSYKEISAKLLTLDESWDQPPTTVQTWFPWGLSQEVKQLLAELRAGMYRQGTTPRTWFTARLLIDYPPRYSVRYDYDSEPDWQDPVPAGAYYEEWQQFPRRVNETPSWLLPKVEGKAASREGLARLIKVYDEKDASGRPVNNRPPIPEDEVLQLLDYLENAPVVLAARGFGPDEFKTDQPPQVPLTFHTDGVWIWPGACAYYLRHYGLAPESDLVSFARACNFQLPSTIGDRTLEAAVALIMGEPAPAAPARIEAFGPLDDADPPLSLFTERAIVEIPVGTGVDRFGEPSGCVTYETGTPYAQRSLPPDWMKNSYHIYRVVRSFHVLKGKAVPWFGQPGGGTAFVLPRSIAELLADKSLIEETVQTRR